MIKDLTNYNLSNTKSIKNFYTKLGIITHFLCDYFCYAHNNKKLDNMFLHLKYEKALHSLYEEIVIDKIATPSIQKVYSLENLINFINNMHYEYMIVPPSMEKDILYALEVSNYTVNFIIDYVKNCNKYNVA